MAPVPTERFAALFRDLDSAERAAFVARLWDARGWETAVDDRSVVAVRGGTEQRIRVVDPGRFGTPSLGDADVLVVARDRAAVRDATAAADVTYLPPERLREQLLYGLDRETAAALFAETFARPLDAPAEPTAALSARLRSLGTTAREAVRERAGGSRGLGVLLVVGLLVGVAVAGPGFSPAGEVETGVPSATYTPDEAGALGGSTTTPATAGTPTEDDGRPAGLGERSITNLSVLLDGHVAGVVGTSRILRVRASGPPDATFMRGRERWNYTVRIEHSREYRFDGRFVFPASTFLENDTSADVAEVSIYADGETKYRRQRTPNGTSYRRYPLDTTGDASGYAFEVRTYLATYLQGDRSIVDCAGTLDSGDCFAYRVVITGAPEAFPDAESYRVVAVVQDDGIVSSFRVSYTLSDGDGDGEREPVRFAVEYEGFGETTVSEPDWLATAKNETD